MDVDALYDARYNWCYDKLSNHLQELCDRHSCLLKLIAFLKLDTQGTVDKSTIDTLDKGTQGTRNAHPVLDLDDSAVGKVNVYIEELCVHIFDGPPVSLLAVRSWTMLLTIVLYTDKRLTLSGLGCVCERLLERRFIQHYMTPLALLRMGPANRMLFQSAALELGKDVMNGLALGIVVSGSSVFEEETRAALLDWSRDCAKFIGEVNTSWKPLLHLVMRMHHNLCQPIFEETLLQLLRANERWSSLGRLYGEWFGVPQGLTDEAELLQFVETYAAATDAMEIETSQLTASELLRVTRVFVQYALKEASLEMTASIFEWAKSELLPRIVSTHELERRLLQGGEEEGYLDFLETTLPQCRCVLSHTRIVEIFCDALAKYGKANDYCIWDPFWLERERLYRLIKSQKRVVLQEKVAERFKREEGSVPDWLHQIVSNVRFDFLSDSLRAICIWASIGIPNNHAQNTFSSSAEIDMMGARQLSLEIEGAWRPSVHLKFPLAAQRQAITSILCLKVVSEIPRDIVWIILSKAIRFHGTMMSRVTVPIFRAFMRMYY